MTEKNAKFGIDAIRTINEMFGNIVYKITLPVAIQVIMSILERFYPDKSDDELYENILFKTNPSLAFQKSDIKSIELIETTNGISVIVVLNFLSIFGASSPLPVHYAETVLENSKGDKILLDFLDMLNHRLKRLIYPIWKKQRYYIQYRDDLSDDFSKYILSIMGLYSYRFDNKNKMLDIHKLMHYAGMLSLKHKSANSLISILRHYFKHNTIDIKEGIISKSHIPHEQYVKLGSANSTIGQDMSIGAFQLIRNLKFRIIFKNIQWSDIPKYSLGGEKIDELIELIRFIQKDQFIYDLAILIKKEEIKPVVFGDSVMLGINTWIGTPEYDQLIITYSH